MLWCAGFAGLAVASVIVARDVRVLFASERHRFANVVIVLLTGNMIAVPADVLLARNRIVARRWREGVRQRDA
ncbi:MAG TPA: hypothetical protein DCG12_23855 [Planctomycetaceae bacterium]|nr:hypothetical protein [Planctomycetaceae bacterium]